MCVIALEFDQVSLMNCLYLTFSLILVDGFIDNIFDASFTTFLEN